jgi:DNA-binding response OmpR family regulator
VNSTPSSAQTPGTILVIDDEASVRKLVGAVLSQQDFAVLAAADGREGLRMFYEARPDLVVVDVNMPGLDGWQTVERLREVSDVPILMLTAHSSEADTVRGFDLGADDYLAKPFGNRELVARIKRLLRRKPAAPANQGPTPYDDGTVYLDAARTICRVRGQEVELTPTEFRLLRTLVEHEGQVLSPEQLLDRAWDDRSMVAPERVKFAVHRLRRKLGWDTQASPLTAVRGFGYRYRKPRAH